ncbi:MAG: tetratricopeptide repeat protein [Bacteroidota bacterium]
MSIHMERGKLLLQQGRVEMAKKELRQELSLQPNNAYAMGLLALCHLEEKDRQTAVKLIETAIGLSPNDPYLFYLQAHIYMQSNRPKDAKAAADNGLLLSPNEPSLFLVKGSIALVEDDWEEALNNAEKGLELDPENVDLVNLRARALIQLNRRQEASATLDYALHRSPEDPLAHTNKGWVAIENDNYDEAVTHFREALRLAPTFQFAKTGLKEAIKGKNILYRQILKFFLWTGKMTDKGRWQFLIGAYILYQIFIRLAESYPTLAPLFYPFIIFYIVWAFSSWIAQPVSNAFLRLHPLGKLALTDDEKFASNVVGSFILLGLFCVVTYLLIGVERLALLGAWSIFMLIPLGGLFGMEAGTKARKYLLYYSLALGSIGLAFIALPHIYILLYTFAIGIFLYGWAANYLVMKAAKEV